MNGRARTIPLVLLAAVLFLLGLGVLTVRLLQSGNSGAQQANVLALPVAVLALPLSAIAAWLAWRSARPTLDDRARARLVRRVRDQRLEAMEIALGTSWRTRPAELVLTNPVRASWPARLEHLLVKWQKLDGDEVGGLQNVSRLFATQSPERMVVLGRPGSGKSMVLSQLALDLAEAFLDVGHPATGVPIYVSLHSLASVKARIGRRRHMKALSHREFDRWLLGQLRTFGMTRSQAMSLVNDNELILILDGLDELNMTGQTRGQGDTGWVAEVLQIMNKRRDTRCVIACREDDYTSSWSTKGSHNSHTTPPQVLLNAFHIVVQPLTPAAICDFLTTKYAEAGGVEWRWTPVINNVQDGGRLASLLSTPWRLFLAVTVYDSPGSRPGLMVDTSPEESYRHLLDQFIPCLVETRKTMGQEPWDGQRAKALLTTVAKRMLDLKNGKKLRLAAYGSSLIDIWTGYGARIVRPVLESAPLLPFHVLMFVGLGGFSEEGFDGFQPNQLHWGSFAIAIACTFVAWVVLYRMLRVKDRRVRRLQLEVLGTRMGMRRIVAQFFKVAVPGITFIALLALADALGPYMFVWEAMKTDGLLINAFLLGSVWILPALAIAVMHASGSDAVLRGTITDFVREGVTFSITVGITAVLTTWLVLFASLHPLDQPKSTTFIIAISLVSFGLGGLLALGPGDGSGWIVYWVGSKLTSRGRPGWRSGSQFLDWALAVGILRPTGGQIQFGHRELHDHLISSSGQRGQSTP